MQLQLLDLDLDLDLPGSEDLPCSDDTPVDNEDQITIPIWLLEALRVIWDERHDWFFGVDMGIYDPEHQRKRTPIVDPRWVFEYWGKTLQAQQDQQNQEFRFWRVLMG